MDGTERNHPAARDLQGLTAQLLEAARRAGADSADAIAIDGTSLSIDVRAGALEHAERSEGVDVAAVYRNSPIDHVARIVSLLGYSAPNFWLGLMGLVVFYSAMGIVGGPGRIDMIYEFDLQPVTGFFLIDSAMARA